jgi:hypothetical protein
MLYEIVLMASNSDGYYPHRHTVLPLAWQAPHHGRWYDAFDGQGRFRERHLCSSLPVVATTVPMPFKVASLSIRYISIHVSSRSRFQLSLWQEMRKEGLPIEGFCVAAGIPSTEKAVEIVDGLRHSQLLTLMDEMKARLNVVALAVTHRVFSS